MVNLGGGFPARYLKEVPKVQVYGKAIFRSLRKHFGNRIPETIIEPGRGLVGDAGMIEAEVVLISKKSEDDPVRWVYLDIGKFGGLAETIDESIRYPIRTAKDEDERTPCVVAGPTCDSVGRALREDSVSASGLARDRRQGADRGGRRLHHHVFVGCFQWLRSAQVVRDLSENRPRGDAQPRPSVQNRGPSRFGVIHMRNVDYRPDIDARALTWILAVGKGNFPSDFTAARSRT